MATRTKSIQPTARGIRQGSDGRWHWQVKRKNVDGSEYRKGGSTKTLPEAEDKFRVALKCWEDGMSSNGRMPTFGEWCDYVKTNILPTSASRNGKRYGLRTVEGYVSILEKWLKPYLGDILLDQMTPEHVDAMLAKCDGAVQSRRNVRNLGSMLYVQATKRGKLPHGFLNPFKAVDVGQDEERVDRNGNSTEARVLTKDEESKLLEAASGQWCRGAILLSLRLGLRIGEVIALEWLDVDLDRKTVTVRHQRQRVAASTRVLMKKHVGEHGLISVPPKSKAGNRMIPMPPSVFEWLSAEREANTTPFVFPNTGGNNPKEPRALSACFNVAVERAKLTTVNERGKPIAPPTFHDLRHTFCTRLAAHVPAHVLKTIAGHSRVELTLSYYVHTDDADLFDAMSKIQ